MNDHFMKISSPPTFSLLNFFYSFKYSYISNSHRASSSRSTSQGGRGGHCHPLRRLSKPPARDWRRLWASTSDSGEDEDASKNFRSLETFPNCFARVSTPARTSARASPRPGKGEKRFSLDKSFETEIYTEVRILRISAFFLYPVFYSWWTRIRNK